MALNFIDRGGRGEEDQNFNDLPPLSVSGVFAKFCVGYAAPTEKVDSGQRFEYSLMSKCTLSGKQN